MAENTQIEWCDHTLNPWEGCQKVAPECDNCYAENRNERFHGGINWGPKAPRRRTSVQTWNKARKWNRQAKAFCERHGRRQRVFCASLADVFDNAVDPAWRADLWELIHECDQMDWLLLTKRPQNIVRMLPIGWCGGWSHVWLGTSAGSQETADKNIPALLDVPAAVRFVSCEPMLGPVDLKRVAQYTGKPIRDALRGIKTTGGYLARSPSECSMATSTTFKHPHLDWVICGGESGPNARPMHPEWARSLRDQCEAADVPFLFKQWGKWLHSEQKVETDYGIIDAIDAFDWADADERNILHHWDDCTTSIPLAKKAAGRLLDGVTHDGFPQSQATSFTTHPTNIDAQEQDQ